MLEVHAILQRQRCNENITKKTGTLSDAYVALSSFFMCMIVANAAILHSGLIWKAVICCILIAVLGIGIALIVQKFLDRGK